MKRGKKQKKKINKAEPSDNSKLRRYKVRSELLHYKYLNKKKLLVQKLKIGSNVMTGSNIPSPYFHLQ